MKFRYRYQDQVTSRLAAFLAFIGVTFLATPFAASDVPGRFQGNLDLCQKVESFKKQDGSLEEALISVILFYANQPEESYQSVQRAAVYEAIRTCHFDGSAVIRAALRLGMPLPILVAGLADAGVAGDTIQSALSMAGVGQGSIEAAFETAGLSPIPTPVQVSEPSRRLFQVTGGLGQPPSSPFLP